MQSTKNNNKNNNKEWVSVSEKDNKKRIQPTNSVQSLSESQHRESMHTVQQSFDYDPEKSAKPHSKIAIVGSAVSGFILGRISSGRGRRRRFGRRSGPLGNAGLWFVGNGGLNGGFGGSC
ncbi:hypothetical protein WICPIJ_003529 [Wickerhamomyces pijperi]|uniref:Uncharacterized protein n=1 Tax=Wickerhamomyces pijperi TaxID=599730 RepID=A0A9P8Q7H2_WICPI|nr:hypothetical protein WICPIJ_003529 [Wickerhamomyces pijperi]